MRADVTLHGGGGAFLVHERNSKLLILELKTELLAQLNILPSGEEERRGERGRGRKRGREKIILRDVNKWLQALSPFDMQTQLWAINVCVIPEDST